jgi:hypothetical protein
MKINNKKNEFNKYSFLERVHDLLSISIIFLDILITFFNISIITNDISISNDIFSNFLQVFVFNKIQFFNDSLNNVCFEHSKFVHRVRYIIYIHQQIFTHNNIVKTHDIFLRHIFILRNRRLNTTRKDYRASTAERDDRASTTKKDDRASTAKRNDETTVVKCHGFVSLIQSEGQYQEGLVSEIKRRKFISSHNSFFLSHFFDLLLFNH